MLFLLDENVLDAVARVLLAAGHEVRYVRIELAPGTTDTEVARHANDLGAIVLTFNHRHFLPIADRAVKGRGANLCNWGLISFRCTERVAARRTEDLLSLLQFEVQQFQIRRGRHLRIQMQIAAHSYKVDR